MPVDDVFSMNEVPCIAVISGPRRGHMQQLTEKTLLVDVAENEEVRVFPPDGESPVRCVATLHRAGDTYEIEVVQGHQVWINGVRTTENQVLRSGDLLELGQGGPVLRYRMYPPGSMPRKSVAEMFADCIDGARVDGVGRWGRATTFISNLLQDATLHSTRRFRLWVVVLLTALVVSVALLVVQNLRLQKQMVREGMRIEGIADLLDKTGIESIRKKDLAEMRREVESQLAEAVRRVEALEARSAAAARIIAQASPSVSFIQGSFGFVDPDTNLPLRFIETDDVILFTFDVQGELVELSFTGTGFVIADNGLMITNRHVAEPWLDDSRVDLVKQKGLTPVIQKLWAFLPGQTDPFALEVAAVSEYDDLSLLTSKRPFNVSPLELDTELPPPGSEVIVLGYPLGVQALMARASTEFIESLSRDDGIDLWVLAQRLADQGYIKPLATQGIVSQVSSSVIVYDAETALGGSGGPVLNLSGKVIAVNFAVMKEFGGANLGVPMASVMQLLEQVKSPSTAR